MGDTVESITKYDFTLHPPAAGASVADRMDFLHAQLDSLYGSQTEILGGLVLDSGNLLHRFQGGAFSNAVYLPDAEGSILPAW